MTGFFQWCENDVSASGSSIASGVLKSEHCCLKNENSAARVVLYSCGFVLVSVLVHAALSMHN